MTTTATAARAARPVRYKTGSQHCTHPPPTHPSPTRAVPPKP